MVTIGQKNRQKTLKVGCQIDIEKLQKQIKSSQIVCQKVVKMDVKSGWNK